MKRKNIIIWVLIYSIVFTCGFLISSFRAVDKYDWQKASFTNLLNDYDPSKLTKNNNQITNRKSAISKSLINKFEVGLVCGQLTNMLDLYTDIQCLDFTKAYQLLEGLNEEEIILVLNNFWYESHFNNSISHSLNFTISYFTNRNPEKALIWADHIEGTIIKPNVINSIIYNIAKKDHDRALQLYLNSEFREELKLKDARNQIFVELAKKDFNEALQLLENNNLNNALASIAKAAASNYEFEQVLNLVHNSSQLKEILSMWASKAPEDAQEWLSEYSGPINTYEADKETLKVVGTTLLNVIYYEEK